MFNSKSTISRFNNGTSISLDDDSMFADVFVKAMKISKTTGGAFDITIAPLVNAWGFGFKSKKMPSAKQVDSLQAVYRLPAHQICHAQRQEIHRKK